jgi:catalase
MRSTTLLGSQGCCFPLFDQAGRLQRPEGFVGRVFDDGARERFIGNVSGHMATCTDKEIIKRQLGIFREVSEDPASRLEKTLGIKGNSGVAEMRFNG